MAARALHGSLISLAAVLGTDVKDEAGASVGRLRDVVVHWTRTASYPRVTGIVVRIGGRDVALGARWLEVTPSSAVRVHSRSVFARAAERHPAEEGGVGAGTLQRRTDQRGLAVTHGHGIAGPFDTTQPPQSCGVDAP